MRLGDRARRIGVLAAVAAASLYACASPGAPPGGPPDKELPVVLKVLPESNAVNVRTPAVVLQFDEVISERSGPATSGAGSTGAAGASGLNGLLVLSPSDGRDEVLWRRTQLELRPRRGLRPNTAYRVTLLPGLVDLRGNRVTEPFSFVFSTGPTIPSGEIGGVLFDWTTGKVAANARVELFLPSDSAFRWSTRSDSSGRFRLRELAPGSYELRAWVDANNDRRISFREVSDSARVALTDTATLELYAFNRDTLPPRLEGVELLDSTAIRIKFDRGVVADWDGLGGALFGADSTPIVFAGPFVPSTRYDSLAKAQRAARDSAAKDSAAAQAATADSTPPAATGRGGEMAVPAPRPPDTVRVENTRPAPRAAAATDTAASDSGAAAADTLPPAPIFNRQVPIQQWTVPLASPLAPGTYRLRITSAPGLNGRRADAEREIRVRPPAPPAAPRDSSARRP